jgi:hypothetical protein
VPFLERMNHEMELNLYRKRVLWRRKGRRSKVEPQVKAYVKVETSSKSCVSDLRESLHAEGLAVIRETKAGEIEAEFRDEGNSGERNDDSLSLKKQVKFRSKQESIIPASRFTINEFDEMDDIEYKIQSLPVSDFVCNTFRFSTAQSQNVENVRCDDQTLADDEHSSDSDSEDLAFWDMNSNSYFISAEGLDKDDDTDSFSSERSYSWEESRCCGMEISSPM